MYLHVVLYVLACGLHVGCMGAACKVDVGLQCGNILT